MRVLRNYGVPGRWCVLSYYTQSPQAPDGSGRILLAGCDLETRRGSVYVLEADGRVVDEFGDHSVESGFFHTGFWQTWSPDGRAVYYQSGSLRDPTITRRELATGREVTVEGDAEGAPPDGEPVVSGLMGMLYAAGYGYGVYNPDIAPVPFENRDGHGVFEYTFEPATRTLRLSVNQMLECHPDREQLREVDRELSRRNGTPSGLTLMCYCVRWSPRGDRMLFHFGNHCVVKSRGEPKVTCVYTCKRDFSDLHMALDLRRGGVHWSWHPDGEHLVGYARLPDEGDADATGLCTVRYDGTGWRKLCGAKGAGHPSVCPTDHSLVVTDNGEQLEFWDTRRNGLVEAQPFPAKTPDCKQYGLRNETRVCHHPVFAADGRSVFLNVLDGRHSSVYELATPERPR
jgi:hypothetical protein